MARPALRYKPVKKDWDRFKKALSSSGFRRVARKHLRIATERNGLEAQAVVRQLIRKSSFAQNDILTRQIKKSSKTLVDKGSSLFQAVTSKVESDTSVFVGVLQTSGFYNIAIGLHDGVAIKVTPAMRQMFRSLWWASIGNMAPSELTGRAAELWERKPGDWLPLKESTTAIIIPPRRFIERAFKNQKLKRAVRANWEQAMARTFRELSL